MTKLPRYDIRQSYDWNYANAPSEAPGVEIPPFPGQWDFCGIPVDSPLEMPAGPPLNSGWGPFFTPPGFSVLYFKNPRPPLLPRSPPPQTLPPPAAPPS